MSFRIKTSGGKATCDEHVVISAYTVCHSDMDIMLEKSVACLVLMKESDLDSWIVCLISN